MVKWYSLFSHTGNETTALYASLSDAVQLQTAITNNLEYKGPLPCIRFESGKRINAWLMRPDNVEPGSIITLNGYMRILPAEVLEYLNSIGCRVFNIHPAPIWAYPELRGKDPQERLWEGLRSGKYGCIGIVIHEVDPGVDTGRIVHWRSELPVWASEKELMYSRLHRMGTEMWIEFFREEMWKDGSNS